MDLKIICGEYFTAWSNKDLAKLADLFDDNIITRDWTFNVEGKEASLDANKNIFDNVSTCRVEPIELYQDGTTVACHINVFINDDAPFEVIDLISFNSAGKITKLLAFRGI